MSALKEAFVGRVVARFQKGGVMLLKTRKLFILVMTFVLLGIISSCQIMEGIGYMSMESVASITEGDMEDVTKLDTFRGENIWKSYKLGGVYRLQHDLYYGKVCFSYMWDYGLFPKYSEPGKPITSSMPESEQKTNEVAYYLPKLNGKCQNDPGVSNIKGIVPKGTFLKAVGVRLYIEGIPNLIEMPFRLMRKMVFWSTTGDDYFVYYARFVDGPFAGEIAFINPISTGYHYTAQSYNSDYLMPVSSP